MQKNCQFFLKNCQRIHKHNKESETHGYSLAMNAFGDLSSKDFHDQYATGLAEEIDEETALGSGDTDVDSDDSDDNKSISDYPKEVDWTQYLSPAQEQASCGACYIFSTLSAVEGRCAIKGWPVLTLSVQEVLDCIEDQSCTKGFQSHVYKWGKPDGEGGYSKRDDYQAYNAAIGECNENPTNSHIEQLINYGKVSTFSSEDLELVVIKHLQDGPMSTAICTTSVDWQFLEAGGVVRGPSCDVLTHGVTLVGYGTDQESGYDYWLIKNSWGTSWGNNGYAKLCRGEKCHEAGDFGFAGIMKQIFYPLCSDYDGVTTGNELSIGSDKNSGLMFESFNQASKWLSSFFP